MSEKFTNQDRIRDQWTGLLKGLREEREAAKERGDRGRAASLASQIKNYEAAIVRLDSPGIRE